MNILLTNDDGISSIGIKKVEEVLKQFGNVYVVAPKSQQSGKGCSLNVFNPIAYDVIDANHIGVEGTPVDCVEVALSVLDVEFDLVVSGCNDGYNLSNDIMYSGTCGACIQALFANKKAIALSIKNKDYFNLLDFFLKPTLEYIFNYHLLSNEYFLNVNFPEIEEYKGYKLTKVYPIKEVYYAQNENHRCLVFRKKTQVSNESDSDVVALKNGYISITPLKQNLFDEEIYKNLTNHLK